MNNLISKRLEWFYNRIRNIKIYGDEEIDIVPPELESELFDNASKADYSKTKKLQFNANVVYVVSDPLSEENMLKKGVGHAISYMNKINDTVLVSGFNSEHRRLFARPLELPDYLKGVCVEGEIAVADRSREDVLKDLEKIARIALRGREKNFCHYIECNLQACDGHITQVFQKAFISELLDELSEFIVKYDLKVEEKGIPLSPKPLYEEAYSLSDLPLIIEHFERIGKHVKDYYAGYGISIKRLNYVSRRDLRKSILEIISKGTDLKEEKLKELEKDFFQLRSKTIRNWPYYYPDKQKKQILIEEEQDFKELAMKLLMFEIIRNCHPLDFENLTIEDEKLRFFPHLMHRDYDPKGRNFDSALENMKKLLKKDGEVGLKNPIIALTGGEGIHLMYLVYYPIMQLPPPHTEKKETYSKRDHGRQMLDSFREQSKIFSLKEIAEAKLNLAVESDMAEVSDMDVLDHQKMVFRSGWKGPGSLNAKRKYGVYVFTSSIPNSLEDYLKKTHMKYTWEHSETLHMPRQSRADGWNNYYAINNYLAKDGFRIQFLYHKLKEEKKSNEEILAEIRKLVV
jgi:hypothetical protein